MIIDRIEIQDGDVLLLRGQWTAEQLADLREALSSRNLWNVLLIHLPRGQDLAALTADELVRWA